MLSEGTEWNERDIHVFNYYKKLLKLDMYVAVSKKDEEKYFYTVPSVVNDQKIIEKFNELCTPNNIERWRETLFNNGVRVKKQIKKCLKNKKYTIHRNIIYQNDKNCRDLINLYKKIPILVDMIFEGEYIIFSPDDQININDEKNKGEIKKIRKDIDFVLEQTKNSNWMSDILERYDQLFSTLSKDSKFYMLNIIDTSFVSSFYVFNRIVEEKKGPRKLEKVYSSLYDVQFKNRDNSIKLRNFTELKDPYHSMFADFPVYQNCLALGKQVDTLISLPLSADFIFDFIKEETEIYLISELEELREKIGQLKKVRDVLLKKEETL